MRNHLNIEILNDIEITGVISRGDSFEVDMRTESLRSGKCILATGGTAAPATGSDGSGYAYAVGLGHSLIKPLPALVPLYSGERWLRRTAGVRCDGSVTLLIEGKEAASDRGELQFADGAISGIPVFQVSRFASVALDRNESVTAVLDFFPDLTVGELARILTESAAWTGSYRSWQDILCGLCNQKIARMICDRLHLENVPVQESLKEEAALPALDIASELKKTIVPINGTGNSDHAQTTCGGIPLAEIGPDMQSMLVPGLYFSGEILNVDGICGGYNLQWAWASGYLAGIHAAE